MQFFMKFMKLTFIYIQKACHFALHAVFIYKKPGTSKKAKHFALVFNIYKNPDTLCYAIFHGIFQIGGGRVNFYMQKNALCVEFLYPKNNKIPLTFIIKKSRHYASNLYILKNALCVKFLYPKFIV